MPENSRLSGVANRIRAWQAARMMRHFSPLFLALAACLALTLPATARAAACAGRDLLPGLPADQRAEIDQAIAASPYPSGNHWRAEKDGSAINVIGTLHLFDPRMTPVAERLTPLIAAADAVYLEATEKEFAEIKAAMARDPTMLVTTGPTLPERLSPAEWQTLSTAMSERGIPPFMASKFRPWYVTMLLGIPPCAMAEYMNGGEGLDHLIGQTAKAKGVPTLALEPYDTVFRIFADMTPEDEIAMIRLSLSQKTSAEDTFATMLTSYFSENHRELWEFSRLITLAEATDREKTLADFAKMEAAILTDRNRRWHEVLVKAAPGKTLVVAVGAAHLGGPHGLLNLLAQDGYSLTRKPF